MYAKCEVWLEKIKKHDYNIYELVFKCEDKAIVRIKLAYPPFVEVQDKGEQE